MREAKLLARLRLQRDSYVREYSSPSLKHKRSAVIIQRAIRRAIAIQQLVPRVKFLRELTQKWSVDAIFEFILQIQCDLESKRRTAYLMFQHMPEKEVFGSIVEELAAECARTSPDYVFASSKDGLRLGYFLNFCRDCSLLSNVVTIKTAVGIFEEHASKVTRIGLSENNVNPATSTEVPSEQNLSSMKRLKMKWLLRDDFAKALIHLAALLGYDKLEGLLNSRIRLAVENMEATRTSGVSTRSGQSLLYPQIVRTLVRHEDVFKPLYVYYSTSEKVRLSHQIRSWESMVQQETSNNCGQAQGSINSKKVQYDSPFDYSKRQGQTSSGLSYAGMVQFLKDFMLSPGLLTYMSYSNSFFNNRQGQWGEQTCSKSCKFFFPNAGMNGNRCRACQRARIERDWEEVLRLRSAFMRVATMDMGVASEKQNNTNEEIDDDDEFPQDEVSLISFGSKRKKQRRAPTFAELDNMCEEDGRDIAMVNPVESMGHIERVLRLFYQGNEVETRRIQHTTLQIRHTLGDLSHVRFSKFDKFLREAEAKNKIIDATFFSLPEFMVLMTDFARVILNPQSRASLANLYEAEDADELVTAGGKLQSLLLLMSHKYQEIFKKQLIQPDTSPVEQSDDQLPAVQETLDKQLRRVFTSYAVRDDPLGMQYISWESFHLFVRNSTCFKSLRWHDIQNIAMSSADPGEDTCVPGDAAKRLQANNSVLLLNSAKVINAPCTTKNRGKLSFAQFHNAVEKLLFHQAHFDHGGEAHMDFRWYQDGSRSSRGISPEGKIKRYVSQRLKIVYEIYQPAACDLSSDARVLRTKFEFKSRQALLAGSTTAPTSKRAGGQGGGSGKSRSGKRGSSSSQPTPQQLLHNQKFRLATQQVADTNASKTVWGALLSLTHNERAQEANASATRKHSVELKEAIEKTWSPNARRSSISRQDQPREFRNQVEQDFLDVIADIGTSASYMTTRSSAESLRTLQQEGSPNACHTGVHKPMSPSPRFRSHLKSPRARARLLKEHPERVRPPWQKNSPNHGEADTASFSHSRRQSKDSDLSESCSNSHEDNSSSASVFHLTMQNEFTEDFHQNFLETLSKSPSRSSHMSKHSNSTTDSFTLWNSVHLGDEENATLDAEAGSEEQTMLERWPRSRFPHDDQGKIIFSENFDSMKLVTSMGRELEASEGAKRHAARFGEDRRPHITFSADSGKRNHRVTLQNGVATISAAGKAPEGEVPAEDQDAYEQKELVDIWNSGSTTSCLGGFAETKGLVMSPRHLNIRKHDHSRRRPPSASIRAVRVASDICSIRKHIQGKFDILLCKIRKEQEYADKEYLIPLRTLCDSETNNSADKVPLMKTANQVGNKATRNELLISPSNNQEERSSTNEKKEGASWKEDCFFHTSEKNTMRSPSKSRVSSASKQLQARTDTPSSMSQETPSRDTTLNYPDSQPSASETASTFLTLFKQGKKQKSLKDLKEALNLAQTKLKNSNLVMAVLREIVALQRLQGDLHGALITIEELLNFCNSSQEHVILRCHILAAKAQLQLQVGDGVGAELTERDRLELATAYALGDSFNKDAVDLPVATSLPEEKSPTSCSESSSAEDDDKPIWNTDKPHSSLRAAQTGVGPCLATLGRALELQNKTEEALEMHQQHLKFAIAAQRWEDEQRATQNIARLLCELHRANEAQQVLLSLLENTQVKGNNQRNRMEILAQLLDTFEMSIQNSIDSEFIGNVAAELLDMARDKKNEGFMQRALEAQVRLYMNLLKGKDLQGTHELARALVLENTPSQQRLKQLQSALERQGPKLSPTLAILIRAESSLSQLLRLCMPKGPHSTYVEQLKQKLLRLHEILHITN